MMPEDRLDILESHVAVRQIIDSYGLAFDTHDRSLLEGLFHADAVMDSGAAFGIAEGRDAIMTAADMLWAKMPTMHHWMTGHIVEVDGDTAKAVTASLALVVDVETGPLQVSGRYRDRFRREGGGWRFAHRIFEMRYATPLRDWQPVMGSDLI